MTKRYIRQVARWEEKREGDQGGVLHDSALQKAAAEDGGEVFDLDDSGKVRASYVARTDSGPEDSDSEDALRTFAQPHRGLPERPSR